MNAIAGIAIRSKRFARGGARFPAILPDISGTYVAAGGRAAEPR
jgi:hypothetical protein